MANDPSRFATIRAVLGNHDRAIHAVDAPFHGLCQSSYLFLDEATRALSRGGSADLQPIHGLLPAFPWNLELRQWFRNRRDPSSTREGEETN